MNPLFLVIGYYTKDSPYEADAASLKLSLEAMGYEYDIREVRDLGSWQKNTQYKAKFIAHMLAEYRGIPLLYLDVDSVVVQPLTFLETIDCDFGAVHFCGDGHLLSGTLYLGNTPECWKLVQQWIAFNEKYPEKLPNGRPAWDQRTLRIVLEANKTVRFQELPQEYTWIVEITQKKAPGLSPIIMHTRGSYRHHKEFR